MAFDIEVRLTLIYDILMLAQVKIHQLQLSDEMKNEAVKEINKAMDTQTIEKDIAQHVKTYFETKFNGTWHCVVGRNFGCSVTHETKFLIFLQVDQVYVLLFSSDEPKPGPN